MLQDATHGPQICARGELSAAAVLGHAHHELGLEEGHGERDASRHDVGRVPPRRQVQREDVLIDATARPPAGPDREARRDHDPVPDPGGRVGRHRALAFTIDDFNAFTSAARGQADFAGLWTDNTTPVDGRANLFPEQVLTVAFTGNLDLHRAQLRVVERADLRGEAPDLHGPTHRDPNRADRHNTATLGLQVVMASADEVGNFVNVQVVLATPAMQAALDRRYGPGVVRLSSVLTRVK